ncbi:hypothetical protein MPSEU_000487000 [Mayamaea pseudoterrestris]|nr:hypothetical protein MPSEU_000487000 [Mayamaea pseudoterrestris]
MNLVFAMVAVTTNLLAFLVSLWSWKLRRQLSTLEVQDEASKSLLLRHDEVPHQSTLSDSEDEASQPDETTHLKQAQDEAQAMLEEAVSESTKEERFRFLAARNGDMKRSTDSLASYIQWKSQYEPLPRDINIMSTAIADADHGEWNLAAARALHAHGKLAIDLPRVARMPSNAVCRQEYRILQILPGLIDDQIADTMVYSLAIALYCDQKLKRDSLERLCVIVDVRSGVGWPNMPITGFISFAKHTIPLLLSNFPERLGSALVYPIPHMFGWVWTTIRYFIDTETRKKFSLMSGSNDKQSPPPYKQLEEFLELKMIELIENERHMSFIEGPSLP